MPAVRTFTGRTTPPVSHLLVPPRVPRCTDRVSPRTSADYEQQRLHLLHKYGIDLESSQGPADGTRTRRLDRKEVERLMGGGDGQGGIFTWREKHGRKVSGAACTPFSSRDLPLYSYNPCATGSSRTLCKSLRNYPVLERC